MHVKRASVTGAPSLRAALVLFAAWLALGACGQQASPTPTAAAPAPTITVPIALPVVISISGAIDEQMLSVLDEEIAAFELANPDVFVEVVEPVGDAEGIREDLILYLQQADPSRDLWVVPEEWVAELAAEGWLVPLDRYLGGAGVAGVVHQGRAVGLRWTVGGRVLVLSAGTDNSEEAFRFMTFLWEAD